MGLAKDMLMNQEERGFWPSAKRACADCVGIDALTRGLVSTAAPCSFCPNHASFDVNDLLERISEAVSVRWGRPEQIVGTQDLRSGSVTDFTIVEVLDNEGEEIHREELVEEIGHCFRDSSWVGTNFYVPNAAEALEFSWQQFERAVKFERRYTIGELTEGDHLEPYLVPIGSILSEVTRYIASEGLVSTIDDHALIHRGRPNRADTVHTAAAALGTAKVAESSGRMHPIGIAMFYGAFDETTMVAEMCDPARHVGTSLSVGVFRPKRELRVVDLTRLPPLPSIFDEGEQERLEVVRFLRRFAALVSKPVDRDSDSEFDRLDYVPTQVLTEFIRHSATHELGNIDGIVFGSARRRDGRNCALFVPHRDCVEAGSAEGVLELTETYVVDFPDRAGTREWMVGEAVRRR